MIMFICINYVKFTRRNIPTLSYKYYIFFKPILKLYCCKQANPIAVINVKVTLLPFF